MNHLVATSSKAFRPIHTSFRTSPLQLGGISIQKRLQQSYVTAASFNRRSFLSSPLHNNLNSQRRFSNQTESNEPTLSETKELANKETSSSPTFHSSFGDMEVGIRYPDDPNKRAGGDTYVVYIKSKGTFGNNLFNSIEQQFHYLAKNFPAAGAVGAIASTVTSGAFRLASAVTSPFLKTSKDAAPEKQDYKPKVTSLWIPMKGTFYLTDYRPPDSNQTEQWHEISYEFHSSKGKALEKFADKSVSNEQKASMAIGMIVGNISSIPFAGRIAENISKKILHNFPAIPRHK